MCVQVSEQRIREPTAFLGRDQGVGLGLEQPGLEPVPTGMLVLQAEN